MDYVTLLIPGLGLAIARVRELVNNYFIHSMCAGWYFQQFLKMGFALSPYAKDYYLIWDADTIPTSPISFFDKNGKMFIAKKTKYHRPYFETMQCLIDMDKTVDFSFIAEHMIIKTAYMKELIKSVLNSKMYVENESWYKIIIDAINPNHSFGFSEFETYGAFVYNTHSREFVYRTLRTFRRAGFLFGRCMTHREIDEFNSVTDTLSLEAGHVPAFPRNIIQYIQLGFLYFLSTVELKK